MSHGSDEPSDTSSAEYDSDEEPIIGTFIRKNFKSDSPVMIYPSVGKVTANGIVSTPCDENIEDRQLKAVLVLPDLKERAAMSSMEGLYELSQRLAVTSPRLMPPKGVKDTKKAADTGITSFNEAQQSDTEETGEEKLDQPEEIEKLRKVPKGKHFVRLPIYSSWSPTMKQNKHKKLKKNWANARLAAYTKSKLKELHQEATHQKVVKFVKQMVQSDVFKVLLLLGLACLISILFYGIDASVEESSKLLRR
ncbi:uncharacterized protein LOC117584257 [Drosophila guanche]|uniref:Uncharacterized protein n=1 Tax=Drosophila guanche TaxID=7266 RepID=A0A3B0JIH1_DROGU|nr:uncharacterized protein LOC117584235 [Drosophila guanche]XP_034128953.1 uncharacterized protein LOC117584257 [Drosophila guanche]SPP82204.1 Hypothetical predicted protein [Drosophila guanche]SPP82211.1 Hypothetical predicted protein [Drosophila guanche]